MPGGQTAIPVLNLVQVFDQQVATARGIAEQSKDFLTRLGINLSPFEVRTNSAFPALPFTFRSRFRRTLRG